MSESLRGAKNITVAFPDCIPRCYAVVCIMSTTAEKDIIFEKVPARHLSYKDSIFHKLIPMTELLVDVISSPLASVVMSEWYRDHVTQNTEPTDAKLSMWHVSEL